MEKYVLIMAGGSGSRLWPLSREGKPKQFINTEDGKCMLLHTIERVCKIVPAEKCFIITNKNLYDITIETISGVVPKSNIILEPMRKNTAACIAYTSLLIKEKFGSGLLCFVPSDGQVKNTENYKSAIEQAYCTAERTDGLVIIGIEPSYPATGYGYVHIKTDAMTDGEIFTVKNFVEKPDFTTAEKFISSGEFLWNSGILIGTVDAIIDNIKLFLPNHFKELSFAVKDIDGQDTNLSIAKAYNELQDISFDKGVLEKCGRICVVKGCFDWNDIGSIDALSETFPSDTMGNSVKGNFIGIDTGNSVIYSEGTFVATVGIENMIIAATKDAILVCPKDRVQDIKTLVKNLKAKGYEHLT